MSHSAASSGQYRPAWKSIVSSDADVAGDGQRVLPDEQVLVRLEPVHRVTRPDPDDPSSVSTRTIVTGKDRTRLRVPGRRERRVQRNHEALQPDGGDPHDGSIADDASLPGSGTAAILSPLPGLRGLLVDRP